MSETFLLTAAYFGLQIVLGLPVGFVLISTVVVYALAAGIDVSLMAERVIFASVENIIVIAIPLFIFTAKVMDHGGISDRLLRFCLALVGHRWAAIALVSSTGGIAVLSLLATLTSAAAGLPLIAAVLVVTLMLRPEVRTWYAARAHERALARRR